MPDTPPDPGQSFLTFTAAPAAVPARALARGWSSLGVWGDGGAYGEHELAASQDVVQEGVVPVYLKGIRESVGPRLAPEGWPYPRMTSRGLPCPDALVRWS